MASTHSSGGASLPTPTLLVGTHVRLEPLTAGHEPTSMTRAGCPNLDLFAHRGCPVSVA